MSVSPRKAGGNGLALDHKRTCLIINSQCLMRLRLTAKGARYLTISFYVALLFTVFALHKVSCYSFIQRTGRAMVCVPLKPMEYILTSFLPSPFSSSYRMTKENDSPFFIAALVQ